MVDPTNIESVDNSIAELEKSNFDEHNLLVKNTEDDYDSESSINSYEQEKKKEEELSNSFAGQNFGREKTKEPPVDWHTKKRNAHNKAANKGNIKFHPGELQFIPSTKILRLLINCIAEHDPAKSAKDLA